MDVGRKEGTFRQCLLMGGEETEWQNRGGRRRYQAGQKKTREEFCFHPRKKTGGVAGSVHGKKQAGGAAISMKRVSPERTDTGNWLGRLALQRAGTEKVASAPKRARTGREGWAVETGDRNEKGPCLSFRKFKTGKLPRQAN